MKKLVIGWNLTLISMLVFLLAIIVPNVYQNVSDKADREKNWELTWPATFEGIFVVLSVIICAFSLSSLFAGKISKNRRIIASILIIGVIGTWIYSGILWVNAPLPVYSQSLPVAIMNNDALLFALVSIIFLLVAAFSGQGLYSWLYCLFTRKAKAQQESAPNH